MKNNIICRRQPTGGNFMKFRVVVQTRTTVFETIIEADHMARARQIAEMQYPGATIGGCYPA